MTNLPEVAVVDLFCGVGGLAHGFVLEGMKVIAGIDSDRSCEFAFTQNNNAKFICRDVRKISHKEIKALFPKNAVKVLVGCAPCQPFSRYTSGLKPKQVDSKWSLVSSFAKIIEAVQPDIVSMENVPQLARYDKNKVYSSFIETLKTNGYFVSNPRKIAYCPEYGVPQRRRRLVILASRFGEIDLIPPTHKPGYFPTVRTAIGKMPKIEGGNAWKGDPLHRAQKPSTLSKKRMQSTKEGGSWRDWPDDLKLDCHKKLSGTAFNDVYGRMVWDEPAPTLTTHCAGLSNGRFGHPEQDRAISLREAAILQSFPPNYQFINPDGEKLTFADLQRHIGNAVPVSLGRAIAKSIRQHLKEHPERYEAAEKEN